LAELGNFFGDLLLGGLRFLALFEAIDEVGVVLEAAEFVELVDGVDVAPFDEETINFVGEYIVLFDEEADDF
jgi:hypothetical protein